MITNLLPLIVAIIMVESGGRDYIINKQEQAYGCLQIREGYLKDANEFAHTKYTLTDMLNKRKATAIFTAYMKRYATVSRLGREPTYEDIARIHNGGPDGWKRWSTIKYWNRVKKRLEEK